LPGISHHFFRFVPLISRMRISFLYREFFTDLGSAHLFNTAVNISTLA
jgi:hypothetical protein